MQKPISQTVEVREAYFLSRLNDRLSLRDKLDSIYRFIRSKDPDISRIAIALYEEETDSLRTFLHITDGQNPLPFYDSKFSESASLMKIKNDRTPRIINNLHVLEKIEKKHSQQLLKHQFRSSYTVPIYHHEIFLGFIFFNSHAVGAMKASVVSDLNMASHIINMLIANE